MLLADLMSHTSELYISTLHHHTYCTWPTATQTSPTMTLNHYVAALQISLTERHNTTLRKQTGVLCDV